MSEYRRRLLALSGLNQGLPPGTTFDFPYTGTVQEVTLPKGRYKLECWGAQGGSMFYSNGTARGGCGGYSKGIVSINETKTFYICVGGQGLGNYFNELGGGWNGGGKGCYASADANGSVLWAFSGGGGGTDIRLNANDPQSKESYLSRFIVAGGGSGSYFYVNTVDYYESGDNGACGGGETGEGSNCGTQISSIGYSGGLGFGAPAVVSIYGHNYGNMIIGSSYAGGGGWYGGGGIKEGQGTYAKGSGGSGFVNIAANAQYRPSGYTGLELESGKTISGNMPFPSVDGGVETGHENNGYARITVVEGA